MAAIPSVGPTKDIVRGGTSPEGSHDFRLRRGSTKHRPGLPMGLWVQPGPAGSKDRLEAGLGKAAPGAPIRAPGYSSLKKNTRWRGKRPRLSAPVRRGSFGARDVLGVLTDRRKDPLVALEGVGCADHRVNGV
jgi:hypothetical protein